MSHAYIVIDDLSYGSDYPYYMVRVMHTDRMLSLREHTFEDVHKMLRYAHRVLNGCEVRCSADNWIIMDELENEDGDE